MQRIAKEMSMDLLIVTKFFMWCTVINLALFLFSGLMIANMPDFAYKIQRKFFKITRERFNVVVYGFLGAFKLLFIFFNLVPYCALLLLQSAQ